MKNGIYIAFLFMPKIAKYKQTLDFNNLSGVASGPHTALGGFPGIGEYRRTLPSARLYMYLIWPFQVKSLPTPDLKGSKEPKIP